MSSPVERELEDVLDWQKAQMQERYGFWRGFALVQLTVAASNKMGGGKQGQIMEGF